MSLFKEHVDIVSDPAFQERVRNDKVAQSIKQALVQAKKNLKIMFDAGIPIGFGTDGGVPNNMTFGRFQGYPRAHGARADGRVGSDADAGRSPRRRALPHES